MGFFITFASDKRQEIVFHKHPAGIFILAFLLPLKFMIFQFSRPVFLHWAFLLPLPCFCIILYCVLCFQLCFGARGFYSGFFIFGFISNLFLLRLL